MLDEDWFAETRRLLAAEPAGPGEASALLEEHRRIVRELISEYIGLSAADAARRSVAALAELGGPRLEGLLKAGGGAVVVSYQDGPIMDVDHEVIGEHEPGFTATLHDGEGRQVAWGGGDSPGEALASIVFPGDELPS